MNTDYFFEFLAKVGRKLVNCKQEALLQRSNSLYSELVCVGLQQWVWCVWRWREPCIIVVLSSNETDPATLDPVLQIFCWISTDGERHNFVVSAVNKIFYVSSNSSPSFNPQFLNIPPLLPLKSWLDILTKLADLSQNFFSSYQKSFFFYPVLENSFCQVKTENNFLQM